MMCGGDEAVELLNEMVKKDKNIIWTIVLVSTHGASSCCGWRKGLQIWRVAANILNKQSRTADKGLSFSVGVGRCANSSSS
jgi:hypothetical protein